MIESKSPIYCKTSTFIKGKLLAISNKGQKNTLKVVANYQN